MISSRALNSLDDMMIQGIKSGLVGTNDTVDQVLMVEALSEIEENKMVILTICSYKFRLIVLIYFKQNSETMAHFARLIGRDVKEFNEKEFIDAISETGNICCGALNRELGRIFPHLGMSTPSIIDKECATYLSFLGVSHTHHFKLEINESLVFFASLAICEFEDLDFDPPSLVESQSNGELEMF
jgi:CheY-specific phosphatase CheX